MKKLLLALFVLLLSFNPLLSAEIEATVTYVSQENIYIDQGRNAGLKADDVGVIKRKNVEIARLIIVYIADNSASCQKLSGDEPVNRGDLVVFESTSKPEILAPQETSVTPEIKKQISSSKSSKKDRTDKLSLYTTLRYYYQDDRSERNYDYSQPQVRLRAEVENIRGTNHTFSIRMNTRQTNRNNGEKTDWDYKFYEVSLSYDNPNSVYGYNFGRVASNRIAGVGTIDGMSFNYKPKTSLTLGAFVGTEPDYSTSAVNTDRLKSGAYVNYRDAKILSANLNTTAALVGMYDKGEIHREFIYLQNNISKGGKWSVYQNAEINLNRGWRAEASDSPVDLSYLSLNMRYSISRDFNVQLSYDNRHAVRTLDNSEIPDSLFDDNLRHGYRLGFNNKLPYGFRLSSSYSLRTSSSGGQASTAIYLSLFNGNIINSAISSRVSFSTFNNTYSHGFQQSVDLSRSIIFDGLIMSCNLGNRQSTAKSIDRKFSENWAEISSEYRANRNLSGGVSYELVTADDGDSARWELFFRFRL